MTVSVTKSIIIFYPLQPPPGSKTPRNLVVPFLFRNSSLFSLIALPPWVVAILPRHPNELKKKHYTQARPLKNRRHYTMESFGTVARFKKKSNLLIFWTWNFCWSSIFPKYLWKYEASTKTLWKYRNTYRNFSKISFYICILYLFRYICKLELPQG